MYEVSLIYINKIRDDDMGLFYFICVDGNNLWDRSTVGVRAREFVDEARGETSLEQRLRRGELALVTTVRLDISYKVSK